MADTGAVTSPHRGAAGTGSLAINGGKPVRDNWLPYGRQSISDEDVAAVVGALRSDFLTQGPAIDEFERKVATAAGAKHAVAFCNGTAALHGAYFAAGIASGDHIVTSAMTFAATANAALYLGATVSFADILADNGNIDPSSVERLITKRTKAIVGIDFGGHPCDVDELKAIAQKHGILFIQDAAHSLGATYKGQPNGSLSDMAMFSFHPVKTVTTGEGGVIVTNSDEYAERMRAFRTHGITKNKQVMRKPDEGPWFYEMHDLGFNYRMTDIQAALGASQMNRLPEFVQRRRQIAGLYRELLCDSPVYQCLAEREYVESAYHLFPVLVKQQPFRANRKMIFEALHAENIGVQVHYVPVYQHPYYQDQAVYVRAGEACPKTEQFYDQVFSLPMFPSMTDSDVQDVVVALSKVSQLALR